MVKTSVLMEQSLCFIGTSPLFLGNSWKLPSGKLTETLANRTWFRLVSIKTLAIFRVNMFIYQRVHAAVLFIKVSWENSWKLPSGKFHWNITIFSIFLGKIRDNYKFHGEKTPKTRTSPTQKTGAAWLSRRVGPRWAPTRSPTRCPQRRPRLEDPRNAPGEPGNVGINMDKDGVQLWPFISYNWL